MPGRLPATLLGLLLSLSVAHAAPLTPPAQPDSGPGGARAAHADLRQWHYGQGDSEFWLFTPVDPLPRSAPLVVFMHGWSVMQPDLYRAWIEHIVRRGAIVIYPRYQADLRTPAANFLDNAAGAIRQALVELQDGHLGLRADLQQVAYLGHSAGGLIATGLAASASDRQLPPARVVMAVELGRSQGPRWRQVPLPDLARLAPGTLLLSVCGEDDNRVGCDDAQRIYREASHLPSTDKNLLLIRSDRHGSPPLLANHAMPTALRFDPRYPPSDNTNWLLHRVQERQNRRAGDGQGSAHDALGVDALDWYGTWKLFDALCDAAFSGRHREIALGGGPAQLSMGQWSDGTPVTPMRLLAP